MKIECVIVCKDYSDFLAYTLPHNMQYLDRIVVITHHSDAKTRALCSKYSVPCVPTSCMHDDGDVFNKGRAINLGLGHLIGQDWLLQMDADIYLPHNFRDLLRRAHLSTDNIYGCDRLNVYGFDHWMKHKDRLVPHFSDHYFVEPIKEFPLGARIIHQEHGYCPLGYFQLWHKNQGKKYPIHQGNAEHTDVLFAALWARKNRVLLPEVFVYHLESNLGPSEMGTNWNGRKTPPFGPEQHHRHHGHHHYHPHHRKDDD